MEIAIWNDARRSMKSPDCGPGLTRRMLMKMILMMAGVSASMVAGSAFAGNIALGTTLGSSLPLAGAGVASIAAVALVAGIRMLRNKKDK
jgi:polyferredoxin